MLPSRLIPIRAYVSELHAQPDRDRLNAARVTHYLRFQNLAQSFILVVPEERYEEALQVLGLDRPDLSTPADEDLARCPQCASAAVEPLPPYLFLFALLALCPVVLFIIRGEEIRAYVALVAGALVLSWIHPRLDRWRCANCSHRWRGELRASK